MTDLHPYQRSPNIDGDSSTPSAIVLGVVMLIVLGAIAYTSNRRSDPGTQTAEVPTSSTTTTRTDPMAGWVQTTSNGGRSDLTGPAAALAVATAETDFDQLLEDCKKLEKAVAHSQGVGPMPDAELQELWAGYLHDLWAASTLCTEGIERPSSWLMSLAGDQIQMAVSSQLALDNALAAG